MQEQDTSRRRKFYDQMSEAYDLGTFEEFDQKMNSPESRRKLHDFIDKDGKYDIGDFAYFDEAMRPVESSVPQQPATQTPQNPSVTAQPTNAVGELLDHNGQPYSQEVLKRYNSPDNKAGNFKDLSQIAKEVEREQMAPTDPALDEGARIGAGLGMIAAMQQQQPQPQENPFSAENPSMMQPKPAEMPLMFKDAKQQSQNPELSKQWVKEKAAEEAMPADTNADFGKRMATLEKAGNAEAARLMNRKEFDQRNFDKFYEGHVAPVFGEEKSAGEKKVQEALAQSNKEDKAAGAFNIPTGHAGFAKAFETAVAKEKYTDPKKIADATLKRVQDDNGAGGFGDYVLSRMGINGGTGEDDGSQPQLSEREKEWMKRLFAKETDEVASKIIDRIYDQYKQEDAPKSMLEYIGGKALHENMVSSLYDALVRRAAGSSEARAQLRAMAYEDFGKDQGWLARVAGGAAPFAVDMIAGGFALPNIVGKAVVKGGTKLAAREVTKQMERRAAARGLEDAALKEAVKGGEEVAQRYLATQAPILNLAINAAGSAANFATYDVQSEVIRQIANGEFKPVDIMKAAGHGAALGGVMGATGGAIANATRNSGLLGKIAGDVAGLGAETAIFGLSSGLQKAIDEGIDIADVDWADTTGEAFGTVVGMKTVGAVMHPKNFLDRYRKSKDYDLKLNQRDLDELKAAGYDLDGIFKGLGKFGKIKPMEGNTIGKAKEITIGNYGKEAKTEEAWVDADNYKAILENPEISTSAKRKIVYLATGKVLTPEPVFGATLNVDEDGHATITTTNAYGAPIETKDYKTEEEAQKDYEKLQQISRTNTVGGLERVAQVAGMPIVVDEAKGRTKNETGVDVDDLDQMSDLDDAHFNTVMDAYTKNLQDAYMEHFNERLKKFGETKEDTRPTDNGAAAEGAGSEPVGGSRTTGGGENPADETGGGSTQPPAAATAGGGATISQERTERRDAAYDRGMAVAENEDDLPAIGQSARLATARLMQQMPDDNPQLAELRNRIMQAIEEREEEEADRLIDEALLTPQQREAFEQWRDAIETQYGIDDAVTTQTEAFEQQRRAQLEAIADPQGNVTQLQLKDGTTAYYKSGDLTNHFGGVMAVNGDGQTVQVPVRDIADIGQPQNMEDILAGEVEQYAADLTDRYQAMFDGTMLTAGQQVDMVMANQSFTATVVGTDPAGNVIFQMEDGSQMPMRPEDAQAAIQEANAAKINQQLQAEAEAARLAEQQERFTNGIQGYAEGQPDLTAAGTDTKAAAEYLKNQFAASGQDPEKARKQYLTDIQNTKEQLKRREDEAIDESYRLRQWLTGNEDIADPAEVEQTKQRIAELENAIKDIRQRNNKYGDIRRELMTADELNQMEQERRKVIFKARSGYQPTLPQRNLATNEERVTMEDGRPNFGLTPVSNANNYLLNHFEQSTEAEQFVNEQRLTLRNRQRDVVQPAINRRNEILNAYASGHLELTPDEVTQLTHEVADLEAQQDALSKEAIRLREIADGIAALYERNGREEQLTPAEQRGKALDKAASKDDKLRIARTLYNIYPEALDIINDQEPRDLEEFIADNLGLNSMNWEGYDMGERHIAGVQEAVFGKKGATRGIGKGYTTNAFNQYLAPTGEGKGFDEIVHGIYESQPDIGDGKRWTTEDISNALQDMLRTAQKPSDISHRIIDNRIAEAEDIVQRHEELDREAEEEAKYQELQEWAEAHHLNPDEVEAYQEYLAEKPWEFDEEVINQIIADDEAKSNQPGKEMDSQYSDRSVGSEGEGGESQVPEVSPAEGTAENPTVAGQPGAEGGTGGEALPDNNVPGRAPNGAIEDKTKGEDLMHVPFAQRLKAAKGETYINPTEAQKEAGNYKMGHVRFGGYRMSIENPKGSIRSGVDKNGKPWSIEMQDTYGYIGKKYGTDGDHLDFFINDDADLDNFDGRVYVVDQKNEDGTFDEHKVMYGYPNWSAAKKAYSRNYEPGWWDKHVMQMIGVKKDDFDKWLADSDHKTKPFAEYYRTKLTKDAVSDPIDQLRADIMERQQKGEFPSLEPSWSKSDLAGRDIDNLRQLRKKKQKDLSTSKVLLGTTDIKPGSKKETTLKHNIAQAELDIKTLDEEIQNRERQMEGENLPLMAEEEKPVKSLIQGELFTDADFLPEPIKGVEELNDEELLKAIGEKDGKERRGYIDEYDRRHEAEHNEESDTYYGMLENENTSLEDAYSMYDNIFKQFKDNGYATPDRTKLLAQIDALESYIALQEEREAERLMENQDNDVQTENIPEPQQKYNQQKEEIRQSGYDLTRLRLRPLKEGEECHVERMYKENGNFDFTGSEKIESIDDVAYIFKMLEDAAVENSFLAFVKDGKPTIIHLGVGNYTSTIAEPQPALAAYNELNPEKVYFIHNHPSGNLKASKADIDIMQKMRSIFGGKLQNAIIIDTKSGKYGTFNEKSIYKNEEYMPDKVENEIPIKVYSFSKQVFDKDWNPDTAFSAGNARDLAKFISSHRLGEHKKMSLIVMNQNLNVTGNVFLPYTTLEDAATVRGADLIARYMNQMGGTMVVLYGNYDYRDVDRRKFQFLENLLAARKVYLQDIIHIGDSAHEMGIIREPEPGSITEAKEANIVDIKPVKNIEDSIPQNPDIKESLEIEDRVKEMTGDEAIEAYNRLNSQMLEEGGLNVDEHEKKVRQEHIAKNGLKGLGQAMADHLTYLSDKYGYGKLQLRWDLLDRIEELGLTDYINGNKKKPEKKAKIVSFSPLRSISREAPRLKRFHDMIRDMFNNPDFDKGTYSREHFDLGSTPEYMKRLGIKGETFTISLKNIWTHQGKDSDHNLTEKEWHELPRAIKEPFLITTYGDSDDKFRLYTSIKVGNKYAVVGVDVVKVNKGKNVPMLELNRIKTVFGRDRYVMENGEKILAWNKNITPEQEALLRGHNFREYPTIQELSGAKIDNISETSKKNKEKFTEIASETGDLLGGVKVKAVNYDEADDQLKREIEDGTKAIYDPNTGEVTLLTDNIDDEADAKRTVCHEKLGHEGLVALLGSQDDVDKFGDFVFKSAGKTIRQRIIDKANENDPGWEDNLRFSHAAQEVIADIAEDGPRTEEEFSLWDKIKHYLIRLLNKMGLRIRGLLNDHDLAYYILKTGEALKKWNQMPESDRTAASRQATEYDIMRSRRGKPRKRNSESMAQYLQRLREWERWKIAEEQAAANNDPMPEAERINEQWHERYNADIAEWKRANNIEDGAESLGEFPKREAGESPQEYATRVADYETQKDAWRNAPSLFDYLQRANEEYRQAYAAWKERYGIREAESVDLGLYEGDPDRLPHIADAEDMEADVRATADLAEAVGIDMSSEGARNHAKLAVIERRKNLESSNAEDAIWIHNLVRQINEEAKRQGVKPKQLREAMADIIEGTYFEDVIRDEDGNVISIEDISDSLPIKKTPGLQAIMDEVKDWYDYFFHEIEDAGLRYDAGYIEQGYVNHVWSKEKSSPEAWKKYVENFQRTKSPNMRDRLFETYRDGRDVGLVPKYSDIADILAHYSSSNNQAIANKKFLDDLSFIVVEEMNTDGEVVSVLPLLNSNKPNIAVEDRYSMYHVPGVGDVWVLNDVKKRFANVFGSMRTKDVDTWLSKSGKVWDTVGSTAKAIQLAWSGFHALALWEVSAAQNGPIAGLKDLFKYIIIDSYNAGSIPAYAHPDDFRFAAGHLVQLGATQDYSSADVKNVTGKLRSVVIDWYHNDNAFKKAAGVAGSIPAILLDAINKGFDKVLWNYLHDGLKISAMMRFKKQIDKRAAKEGLSDKQREQLYDEAGQYVNDMFGGQYFELLNISPASIKWLRRLLLSPDWLISTNRHFFANFGFGSLYNESGFLNYLRYNADNIERAFGAKIPRNENRRFRSRNAKLCYLIGVGVFWNIIYNALNMLCRHQDEQTEKEKADEIRKTNPEYKSPYELKYPDGMKWYDYTMYGNTLGQQTHLFTGRYKDGTETYVRWGKQFREFPELFLGRHGWELPTPLIERMKAKANPNIGTGLDVLGALGVNGFEEGYQNREIREKYGRTVSTIAAAFRHFIPFGVPTQPEKEYKALDFFMPSSKGFSRWKAIDYFKTFIIDGDIRGVEDTYNAAVMNGIDAEECLKAAIATVKATQRKELQDGIVDLQSAMNAHDASQDVAEKKRLRQKIFAYLAEQEYKPFARDEAREQVEEFLNGEQPKEQETDFTRYLRLATSEDVRDEYRLKSIRQKAKKYVDEVKTAEGERQQKLEDTYGNWLDIYDIINGANSEINGLKKWLGKEGEDDAAIMQDIRDVRQQAQKDIDEIKAP